MARLSAKQRLENKLFNTPQKRAAAKALILGNQATSLQFVEPDESRRKRMEAAVMEIAAFLPTFMRKRGMPGTAANKATAVDMILVLWDEPQKTNAARASDMGLKAPPSPLAALAVLTLRSSCAATCHDRFCLSGRLCPGAAFRSVDTLDKILAPGP